MKDKEIIEVLCRFQDVLKKSAFNSKDDEDAKIFLETIEDINKQFKTLYVN